MSQTDLILETLISALCTSYVRRETRFYHVDYPAEPLSHREVEQSFIATLGNKVPPELLTSDLLRKVFDVAIERKSVDRARTIALWAGALACHRGNANRLIWKENGTVSLNTWKCPYYRNLGINAASYDPFEAFFNGAFPREKEQTRVLDWLAYCIRHEDQKPA